MDKDRIYRNKQPVTDFVFNERVAHVFDDMVMRSIPNYQLVHQLIIDVLSYRNQPLGLIYDLGCSTGNTVMLVQQYLQQRSWQVPLIAVDNSAAMLAQCRQKLNGLKSHQVTLLQADIATLPLQPAELIVMNYTLQFVPQAQRLILLQKIFAALQPNGILILAEKLASTDSQVHNLLDTLYYDFKRQHGYSELEIAQKREALEKVLIPFTMQQQLSLLQQAGFPAPELVLRWYNFGCFLAIKPA